MKIAWITPKNLAIAIGVILAFVGGRFSVTSQNTSESEVNVAQKKSNQPRSTTRTRPNRLTARVTTPGAGSEALKTAEQLRDLFQQHGNRGLMKLQAALAKMNSAELAELAADIEDAHANKRGQQNWYEIPQTFIRWAEVDPEAALRFAKSSDTQFHRTALQNVITTIASQDAVFALSEAKKIDNHTLATQIKAQVMAVMATSDPDAWIAEISSDPMLKMQYGYVGNYVAKWFEKDPAAAIARIKRLPMGLIKNSVAQIASAWAGKDSAAAIKWAETLENPQSRSQAIASIASILAKEQPERAFALIENLPKGSRNQALASIYKTMAQTNPMAAFEQASSLPNSADRHTALNSIFNLNAYQFGHRGWSSYAHMQGQAAPFTIEQLRSITPRLPEGNLRDAALGQITRHLMNSTLAQTSEFLSTFSESERAQMTSDLIQSIHNTDPEKALALHSTLPEKNHHTQRYYASLLSSLARIKPDKAFKLALAGDTENERSNYLSHVMGQIVNQDPQKMAQRIATIRDEKLRTQAIATTASTWGSTDPDAALIWANRLANNEKHSALSAIIPNIARHDPIAATRHFDQLAAISGADKKHVSMLASVANSTAATWSRYDPEAASKWVKTIADENAQRQALATTVTYWAARDLEQAGQWVDTFPEGKTRDSGVQSLVNSIQNKKPESAFYWAETMSDENKRRYALRSIVRKWKQTDAAKARAAVEQADLTEKEYEYLIKELKP